MTTFIEFLFWFGFLIVFYAYVGYGLILYILVKTKRSFDRQKKINSRPEWPEVTFVVCAYNEAGWMKEKIANSLALDYPRHLLHFCFVTDGSNDATPELVREYPYPADVKWQLLHQAERRGKIAAFQRAMDVIQTPIVISTDANTLVNTEAVKNLVRHFQHPSIGAVAGEKRIVLGEKDAANSAGEGIYWRYESGCCWRTVCLSP
jgi:poly-beta-1,6-N-acetyl-D-glucosamine synthase